MKATSLRFNMYELPSQLNVVESDCCLIRIVEV